MRKRKCRVCKVEKAVSQLDGTGRCYSCARVKAATDAGMTYGKYTAMNRCQNAEKQAMLEKRIQKERYTTIYCRYCGGIIPTKAKYEGFCSLECSVAFNEQRNLNESKGVYKKPREKVCLNCGAPLGGNRRYCSNRCKYIFNQQHIMKQQREYREKKREEKRDE